MSSSFEKEGGVVAWPPSLYDHTPQSIPPLAPPLPPPLPVRNPEERKRRVRSFFWKPIPEDRVKQQNRPNLWSSRDPFHIDIRAIEELFGHEDTPSFTTTCCTIGRRHTSVKDLRPQITILDSKRSLNICIFLKHFKKSSESLLDDILHGNTGVFSVESLRELLKLLPEDEEVKNLQIFNGNPKDLAPPDAFIHKLIHLPRYEVRLEALLLKEEFFPSYTVMKHDMTIILSTIKELLSCEELHDVLHLVLQAGNIMNAGGSAGNAVGFKLSSLLSLADTKANKPGINLLHFVALEAQKKDLIMFPEKLQHVQQAVRVCVNSINDEFHTLTRRVHQLQQTIHSDDELLTQLQSFLQSAAAALEDLRISIDEVQREGDALIDFFCEDRGVFKLDECFRIFQNFCSKFKKAVQENAERGMWEESRRKRLKESEDKRHSWAGHGDMGGVSILRSNSEADVAAVLKREGLLELLKTSSHSPRRSPQQNSVTFDPCGSDTLVFPPIHSLSTTNMTEEPEIPNKTLSVQESQNNDLQTQENTGKTLGTTELTPDVTFDPFGSDTIVLPPVLSLFITNTTEELEIQNKTLSMLELHNNDLQTQSQEISGNTELTPDVTFDPCGSHTLVLPPIHSLSISNMTEELEIQNKTLSMQESQNNDLQTQSQETSGNTELTPDVTFDPCGSDTLVLPPIHSLSISNTTEELEIHNKTLSTQESQNNNLQTQEITGNTLGNTELTPDVTFDPCGSDTLVLPPIHPLSISNTTEEPGIQNKTLSIQESQNNILQTQENTGNTLGNTELTPDVTFDPCGSDTLVLSPIHSLSISNMTEEPEIQNKTLSIQESQNNDLQTQENTGTTLGNTELTPDVTFDPCGSDTLVLPPIHSLSISNTTEEIEIQNKTLSIQESQNNDLQTESQETSGNTELTPSVTSDPSRISLVVESEVVNDESERKTKDIVQPTKESLKTSTGAKQTISKRTFISKNRASLSEKSPSSSIKPSTSSPKCVSASETASVRKLIPLRQPRSSSAQIQERTNRSVLSRAKTTQAFRPEEKMCRVTLRSLDCPSPQTSACNSTVKPPSFARNTVASTTRHATTPGNQAKAPALTRAASLRLSQVLKPMQMSAEKFRMSPPAGCLRKSSSTAPESSMFTCGSRDKNVKPTWK
ncbi:formin-J isoform X1 [Sinocyclocheilus grahami]|uniref:FH2 domain-containing protein 1-like n=1 Tax=Sinocyclocheilus grahami TaxID=75366 RepID=A0A672PYK1_SINGR|nr:PREDICTED: formin-J-like isoform X1 [Sinocyclocheilus grahami]